MAQSFGQNTKKVEDDVVFQTLHHKDSTASAAYLLSSMSSRFIYGSEKILLGIDYHFRIKVYSEEGEKYGKFSIPLYNKGSNREKVTKLKAYTYNVINGKVEKHQLSKKNVYEEESTENWKQVKFALPNVKSGSVIDVKYTINSPYIYTIPKWDFQNDIPTNYSNFKISIPSNFVLTPIATGTISLYKEEKDVVGSNFGERMVSYAAKNIPAFKDDDYILNENDYKSGVKFEIHSFIYHDGRKEYFSKDWKTIGDNLLEAENFGRELKKKTKDLDFLIDEALALSLKERTLFIYDYVRTNFNWNKSISSRKDVGIKDLIKTKTGNIGDINLLLLNLLKRAEVTAFPVVTKSRFRGLLNKKFPSLSELNYLIILVRINNEEILLDATSKYVPAGMLPTRAVNINGLLVEKSKSRIIDIFNPNKYQEVSSSKVSINEDDMSLNFEGVSRLSKFASVKYRIELDDKEEDEDNQDVDGSSSKDVDDEESDEEEELQEDTYEVISIENLDNIYKPISLKFNESKFNKLRKIGPQLFIDGDFNEGISENPFTDDERDFPIFYNQLNDIRRIFNLEIPEGYELESYPEKLSMVTDNGLASFTYDPKLIGNKLNVVYYLKIKSDIFLPEHYKSLKRLYDKIIAKQDEKIVLKKKT